MPALVTARRGAHATGRLITRSLTLALVTGCKAKDTSGAGKSANAQAWANRATGTDLMAQIDPHFLYGPASTLTG